MHALDVLGGVAGTPVPVRRRLRTTREVGIQLERFRRFWSRHLDALGAELARARRERHHPLDETPSADGRPGSNNEEKEDE
ncbi:hypothetical protein ACFPOI_21970 [Nonomuraea angiospora]|uniref:Transcriptional regulator n=1 Tax=Nonomuraea angiospora TaxID=46172 RepID=A0ABR9MLX3_9ACTN|nr:hypothetical protein [Nonomuraea angiospora]MBE1593336.1 hypothetical protein [Nonomuraea angiospora]